MDDGAAFSLNRSFVHLSGDGVNFYEQQRATMIAQELGYVGFAADIYGMDKHEVSDIEERSTLAGLYRENATLFFSRIEAAIQQVKTLDEVDSDNVAAIGYCFGGTGVITYGLLGGNGVKGLVSFHGGLTRYVQSSLCISLCRSSFACS